jgi:exosortase/archaeosortase family protein
MDPAGKFQYEVAAACSGMRSLIATIAIGVIYAMVSFRSWWRRILLMASTVPLAVLGNVVRMLTIVIAADLGGQEWGNAVHDGGPGGIWSLLPYVPAFGGLMFLGSLLREPDPPETGTRSKDPAPVTAPVAGAAVHP